MKVRVYAIHLEIADWGVINGPSTPWKYNFATSNTDLFLCWGAGWVMRGKIGGQAIWPNGVVSGIGTTYTKNPEWTTGSC